MALREDVHANPACAVALAARDCVDLARIMSIGRTALNKREIGNGTILEVLGLGSVNALLDVINNNTNFRYVKPLVEQGRMMIGSPLVRATLQSLVPAVLTQVEADRLLALGVDPDPYTASDMAEALFNTDGTQK